MTDGGTGSGGAGWDAEFDMPDEGHCCWMEGYSLLTIELSLEERRVTVDGDNNNWSGTERGFYYVVCVFSA